MKTLSNNSFEGDIAAPSVKADGRARIMKPWKGDQSKGRSVPSMLLKKYTRMFRMSSPTIFEAGELGKSSQMDDLRLVLQRGSLSQLGHWISSVFNGFGEFQIRQENGNLCIICNDDDRVSLLLSELFQVETIVHESLNRQLTVPSHLIDYLLSEFAKFGVPLLSMKSFVNVNSLDSRWSFVLSQFRVGKLFKQDDLNTILPKSQWNEFHIAFLEYLRANNLFTIIERYIAFYQLFDIPFAPNAVMNNWISSVSLSQCTVPSLEEFHSILQSNPLKAMAISLGYKNNMKNTALSLEGYILKPFMRIVDRRQIVKAMTNFSLSSTEFSVSLDFLSSQIILGQSSKFISLDTMLSNFLSGQSFRASSEIFSRIIAEIDALHPRIVLQRLQIALYMNRPALAFQKAIELGQDQVNVDLICQHVFSVLSNCIQSDISEHSFIEPYLKSACFEFLSLYSEYTRSSQYPNTSRLSGYPLAICDLLYRVIRQYASANNSAAVSKLSSRIARDWPSETVNRKKGTESIGLLECSPYQWFDSVLRFYSQLLTSEEYANRFTSKEAFEQDKRYNVMVVFSLHVFLHVRMNSEWIQLVTGYKGFPLLITVLGDVMDLRPDFTSAFVLEHFEVFGELEFFQVLHSLGLPCDLLMHPDALSVIDISLYSNFLKENLLEDTIVSLLPGSIESERPRLHRLLSFILRVVGSVPSWTELSVETAKSEMVSLILSYPVEVVTGLQLFYPGNFLIEFTKMVTDFCRLQNRLQKVNLQSENMTEIGNSGFPSAQWITQEQAAIQFMRSFIDDQTDFYGHIMDSPAFSRSICDSVLSGLGVQVTYQNDNQDNNQSLEGVEYDTVWKELWEEYQTAKGFSILWKMYSQRLVFYENVSKSFKLNSMPYERRGEFYYRILMDHLLVIYAAKWDSALDRKEKQTELLFLIDETRRNWIKCDPAKLRSLTNRLHSRMYWFMKSFSMQKFTNAQNETLSLIDLPQSVIGLMTLPLLEDTQTIPWTNDENDPLDIDLLQMVFTALCDSSDLQTITNLALMLSDQQPLLLFIKLLLLLTKLDDIPLSIKLAYQTYIYEALGSSLSYKKDNRQVARSLSKQAEIFRRRLGFEDRREAKLEVIDELDNETMPRIHSDSFRLLDSKVRVVFALLFGRSVIAKAYLREILKHSETLTRLGFLDELLEELMETRTDFRILRKLLDIFKKAVVQSEGEGKRVSVKGSAKAKVQLVILDTILKGESFTSCNALLEDYSIDERVKGTAQAFQDMLFMVSRANPSVPWWPLTLTQLTQFASLSIDRNALVLDLLSRRSKLFLPTSLDIEFLLLSHTAASSQLLVSQSDVVSDALCKALLVFHRGCVLRGQEGEFEQMCLRVLVLTQTVHPFVQVMKILLSIGSPVVRVLLDDHRLREETLQVLRSLEYPFWQNVPHETLLFLSSTVLYTKFVFLCTELSQVMQNQFGKGYQRFVVLLTLCSGFIGAAVDIQLLAEPSLDLLEKCLKIISVLQTELSFSSTRVRSRFDFSFTDDSEFEKIWKFYSGEDEISMDALKRLVQDIIFSSVSETSMHFMVKKLFSLKRDGPQQMPQLFKHVHDLEKHVSAFPVRKMVTASWAAVESKIENMFGSIPPTIAKSTASQLLFPGMPIPSHTTCTDKVPQFVFIEETGLSRKRFQQSLVSIASYLDSKGFNLQLQNLKKAYA